MSVKSKQIAYSCNMQAVDALKEDGAVCNFYRKSYDEEATAEGGTGNRKVFKIINDEINEYQDIYKILTGEQRSKITEEIPVINYYTPENTGFAYHYNRDKDGNINQGEITALNLSADETAPERSLEYIEREDPYIINRALLGEKSSMGQQFWGTSGQQMSDFNLQTTYKVKKGGIKYIYNGIFPKDFVTYVIGDYTTGKEYRPDEIYIFKTSKASASLSITLSTGVKRQESIVYTDDSNFSVGIFLPAASYRDDPARFLILSCLNGTWALDFAEEISSYTSSVEFPMKLQPGSSLPNYLIGSAQLLAKYLNIERQSLSEAPGLLNGLYTKPNSFDQYNNASVADWLLNDDRALAQKTGADLALGTKYYPGHILHRGLVLSSPFRTTNEEEADFPGKLSYITNLLSNSNPETFFDPVEVDNWGSFTARKVKVSNRDSWGSDYRFQKAEGEYISYNDIEALIQGFKNLLVVKSGTTYLNLTDDAEAPILSYKFTYKNLLNKTNTVTYGSADDMKTKWNKFIWAELYKDVNWGIISDTTSELQKLSVKNIVDAFGGSSNTPVLIWPEDNDHFPREVYLFSKVDLQLKAYDRTTPDRALCSFYSEVDGVKRVLSFKVSKAEFINIGSASAIWRGDVSYTSSDLASKLNSLNFYVYSLEAYGADTSEITYYDRNGVAKHFVSNAAIPALAYPTDYFAVEPGTAKNQIFEYHDPARTAEFLGYLEGSVIVPGLPTVKDYKDFSTYKKTDCTPKIDCRIFEDMVRDNKAIAKASFSAIESVINEWPLTKGANPLVFGQLQSFLRSLLTLNDRLSEFVKVIPALEGSNFDVFRERLWRDTTSDSTLADFTMPKEIGDSYLRSTFPDTLNACCNDCTLTLKPQETYVRKSISYLAEVVDAYMATPTVDNAKLVDQCLGNNTLAFLRFDSTGTAEEGINDFNDEVSLLFNEMQEGARQIIDWASTAFFTRELNSEVYGTDLYGEIITPEKLATFKKEWDKLIEEEGNTDSLSSDFRAYFRETDSRTIPSNVRKIINNSFLDTAAKGMLNRAAHNGSATTWQGWFAETVDDDDWKEVGTMTRMLQYASGQRPFDKGTTKNNAIKKAFQAALASVEKKLAEQSTPALADQKFIDYTVQQLGGEEITTRDDAINYIISKICTMTQAEDDTYSLIIGTKTISGLHSVTLDEEADLKIADLIAIANYIKAKLVGETDSKTGLEVNGVEYLPNGTLSGDERSLYYKRYLILNDRMNKCNGTLAKAANFINNSSVYETVNTFNEGKIASYKDYIEAEKVAEMREMYYMPAAINNAAEPIFGKFYDKEMLDNVKSYLSQNCVLTCTKCSVAESCPFYDINGLLDRWVPEKTTIDLKLKDNELDLLSYDPAPPTISGDSNLLGLKLRLPLGTNKYKEIHRPYIDVLKSTSGTKSKIYEGIDFHDIAEEMDDVDRQDNLTEDNTGRIIGGRYGTIQVNEASQSQNALDSIGMEDILHYKYLYDAVFISDAEEYKITDSDSEQEVIEKTKHNNARTCFNYRASAYRYPVEVDLNGKHYSGSTNIKIPSGLKLLDAANDWDDVYLASDDVIKGSKPLIYLGLNCNVKNLLMFDLTDTAPNEEVSLYRDDNGRVYSTANTLYAQDVAQWSVNILKGRMNKNPLGDNPNNILENRDQYWMETIQKPVMFEGKAQYVECPGRPRVRTGFTEMITDGQDITKGSLISGKPFANTYVDFVREVRIVFKNVNDDGTSTDLIPWVKGSKDPYEIQARREALPKMSTNLRLVLIKNEKPDGWDGIEEVQIPAPIEEVQKAKTYAANLNAAVSTWLSQAMASDSNSLLPIAKTQDADAILKADLKNTQTLIAEAARHAQEKAEALANMTPGGTAADVAAAIIVYGTKAIVTMIGVAVHDTIVQPIEDAYNTVADAVKSVGDWIGDTATNTWNGVCDIASSVGNAVADSANWVADRAEEVWNDVTNVAEAAKDAVVDGINYVGDKVSDAGKAVGGFFKKLKFW